MSNEDEPIAHRVRSRRQRDDELRLNEEEREELLSTPHYGNIHAESVADDGLTDFDRQTERIARFEQMLEAVSRQCAELSMAVTALRETRFPSVSMNAQAAPNPGAERTESIKPNPYDGCSPWDEYWVQFQAIIRANNWQADTASIRLLTSLKGPALAVVCNIPESNRNLHTMKEVLAQRFGAAGQERLYLARLRRRIQGPKEDVATFGADVESLARRAVRNEHACESIAIEQFMNGLHNQRVRELVIAGDPTTLRDAIARAINLEAGLASNYFQIRQFDADLQDPTSTTPNEENFKIRQIVQEELRNRKKEIKCWRCNKIGHYAKECRENSENF
ncbi:unnamed protein product [Nesidiocoris tenuis]|uniref:CCHC-type domain-containing protein n=1 Tax=Nesidiocoris tenuis TaxID=355587 RepID=A0A6H5FXL7_9HEMI|nr:unnamed protein product [Nesidiocoris tenuis]